MIVSAAFTLSNPPPLAPELALVEPLETDVPGTTRGSSARSRLVFPVTLSRMRSSEPATSTAPTSSLVALHHFSLTIFHSVAGIFTVALAATLPSGSMICTPLTSVGLNQPTETLATFTVPLMLCAAAASILPGAMLDAIVGAAITSPTTAISRIASPMRMIFFALERGLVGSLVVILNTPCAVGLCAPRRSHPLAACWSSYEHSARGIMPLSGTSSFYMSGE